MTEYAQNVQFVAGMQKLAKVTVKRKPKLYIGRRKRAQLRSGRTRK